MIVRRSVVVVMVAAVLALTPCWMSPAGAQVESPPTSSPASTVVAPADAVGEVDNSGGGLLPDTGAGQTRDIVGKQAGGVPMLLAVIGLFGVVSLLAWRPWKRKPPPTSAKLGNQGPR